MTQLVCGADLLFVVYAYVLYVRIHAYRQWIDSRLCAERQVNEVSRPFSYAFCVRRNCGAVMVVFCF